jgi:uncharacterized protein YdeI (YjbR/CyaY-like superfamily)
MAHAPEPALASDAPADLMAALAAAGLAEAFLALPPSHRKEYVEWIDGAKKPETRRRRIEGTVERLAGKPSK